LIELDFVFTESLLSETASAAAVNDSNWESQHAEELHKLAHSGLEPWRMLSQHHWASILRLYNISTAENYLSILPPIGISIAVPPHSALILRNPNEKGLPLQSQWQVLAAALDPLDFAGEMSHIFYKNKLKMCRRWPRKS
jgi:hypothetical protein